MPTLITSSPTPRTGTYAARGSDLSRSIAPATNTLIVGFAFYWNGAGSSSVSISNNAAPTVLTMQTTLELTSGGTIRIRTGSSTGTILATSAVCLNASSWNFIEWKTLVDNSGTYTVKVNGLQVLNGSGDTQGQSTSTIAAMAYTIAANMAIDDVYLLDTNGSYLNDFIGDCKVECLTPSTGNGTNTGLTTSTGADHGALVDESPANDDTDYNYGTAAGVKDTYNFPSLATTGAVKAVQVSARAKKTDSATKELAIVARENSTDSDGATQALSTSYTQYQQIWEKRPSDNSDWTSSDVNAGEFGLKVVS